MTVLAGLLLLATPGSASALLAYEHASPDNPGGNFPIMAARNDGTDARVIASGSNPMVSPSGCEVAYFVEPTGRAASLHVVDVHGHHHHKLVGETFGGPPPAGIAWSPDSRFIVVSDAEGRGVQLIDVARRHATLIQMGGDPIEASFAPDGKHFVVDSGDATRTDLVVVSVATHRKKDLGSGGAPRWGPPGFAFVRGQRIMLRRPGQPARTLADQPFPTLYPVDWSANGHRLLIFEGSRQQGYRAAIVGRQSGELTRIPTHVSAVTDLSRRGHAVLAERNGNVISLQLDGSTRVLARGATSASWTK